MAHFTIKKGKDLSIKGSADKTVEVLPLPNF